MTGTNTGTLATSAWKNIYEIGGHYLSGNLTSVSIQAVLNYADDVDVWTNDLQVSVLSAIPPFTEVQDLYFEVGGTNSIVNTYSYYWATGDSPTTPLGPETFVLSAGSLDNPTPAPAVTFTDFVSSTIIYISNGYVPGYDPVGNWTGTITFHGISLASPLSALPP